MAVILSPIGGGAAQFFDNDGNILSGGKIYTYAAGSTTPQATYTTSAGNIAHSNPIILNSAGRVPSGEIWLTDGSSYKFVIKDANDTLIGSYDNIVGINPSIDASQVTYDPPFANSVATNVEVKLAQTVSVLDFGADPTGTTTSHAAFQNAVNAANEILIPSGTYLFSSPVTLNSNNTLRGIGTPTITTNVAGMELLNGVSLTNVQIYGINFDGAGSSTIPINSIAGQASSSTGLVTLNFSSNLKVENNTFTQFYNGFTSIRSNNVWFCENKITHWMLFGVLGSESSEMIVENNIIVGCDQTGAIDAYGVMITGDSTNSHPSVANSISFNVIHDIPSWDGIMSHESTGMRIIGNDIRNVRNGIDFGLGIATNVTSEVQIIGNYVQATNQNTWGSTPGNHSGIIVNGLGGSLPSNIIVSNNIIDRFYNVVGLVPSGNYANISITETSRASVTGNIVANVGNQQGSAGILVAGNSDGICLIGNSLSGSMASGGIRFASAVANGAVISDNVISQVDTTKTGIFLSGTGTISNLALGDNSSNSNAGSQYVVTGPTVTYNSCSMFYSASSTVDPSSLATLTQYTATISCAGANLGDFVEVSFSLSLQGITLTAFVSATNTVTVVFFNGTAGTIDLASGTVKVRVKPAA